ncbi:MAG: site-specific integrase [Clostridia bacterium]|nr:site-specific integrase [Clostridia bacterium]
MGAKTARRVRGYGNGSVYFRASDQRWVGKYKIGTKSNGKPAMKVVYGKTEAECHRKLKDVIDEAAKTEYIEVQNATVKDYMDEWLTSVKKNELKPKSFDRLEQTVNLYVNPAIGHIQLQAIKSKDVQTMINNLRDSGKSHSTIKKAYDAVNACFKLGVIQKTVASNPAIGVTIPSKKILPPKKIQFYTKDEATLLTKQAMSCWGNGKRRYPLGAFVPLLINTGLRAGELLALKWDQDVDIENKALTIHNNIVFVKDREKDKGYKLLEQDSVKTDAGQDRTIPLNDDAIAALLDIRQVTGGYPYVMTTSEKNIVKPRQLDQMFRRIATASGLPEEKIYGVHSLRHTFATLLLSNDVDIKTVSKLLGHSDVTITYNTYIHVIKEQEAKALDAIPKLISK